MLKSSLEQVIFFFQTYLFSFRLRIFVKFMLLSMFLYSFFFLSPGNHSGPEGAKIKPQVEKHLKSKKYKFVAEKNGSYRVTL